MSASWKDYQAAAEKGPQPIAWKAGMFLLGLFLVITTISYILGWFGEAARLAQDQVGPTAALQKYEWFIDQSSRIDKMDKDAEMFEKRVVAVEARYKSYGEDRGKWAPHIQVQYNRDAQQAKDDLLAITSQRNSLAREYNAASEKFNWQLFNSRSDLLKVKYDVK